MPTLQQRITNGKKTPLFQQEGYLVDPRIFATGIILIFIATIMTFFSPQSTGYAECPLENGTQCINPFMNDKGFYSGFYYCTVEDEKLCERPFIQPGESVGIKPGFLRTQLPFIILLTTITIFLINHLLHNTKWK